MIYAEELNGVELAGYYAFDDEWDAGEPRGFD